MTSSHQLPGSQFLSGRWPVNDWVRAASERPEAVEILNRLRIGVWSFGIASWLFGICDRTLAATADGVLSAIEIMQLSTASFFLVAWILLKPAKRRLPVAKRRRSISRPPAP